MALSLGRLVILAGAGLVGSVLAKEGRVSDVSGFLYDALKIVSKQLRQTDSGSSNTKPRNDSLAQQINSLRQELLASSRSVTIVTSSGSGSSKYGVVIIVVVVGYGYIWWKGWKLSDMMFATKRGLSDACTGMSKQLESVYSSISATKRHLSSRIDRVDGKIDECADNTAATKEQVSELRGDMKLIGADVQTVHNVVKTLETKISRIEGKQNETIYGVGHLIAFVKNMENIRSLEPNEAALTDSSRPALELPTSTPSPRAALTGSSRPALELPPPTPSSRAGILPTKSSQEPSSPSVSNGSFKRHLQTAGSASGLKELHGISEEALSQSNSFQGSNNSHPPSEDTHTEQQSTGLFGRGFPGISASFLTRGRSTKQSSK